ncbi:MAG: hypothetical protein A2X94_09820 [Bdellovibrionales bacterium GWB1_55_8]|nr:MAG: hypothetical protein A2X94_09820 [Bdellovibrionales bacterium GWB1_55_8]
MTTKEVKEMLEQQLTIDEDVSQWLMKPGSVDSFVKLPGDASTRQYFRMSFGNESRIVMKMEAFRDRADKLPFLIIQEHLASVGIPVPAVYDVDPDNGLIVLEDLGDMTLLRKLQEVSNADVERHLYEQVINSLVELQVKASPGGARAVELDAFKLRFDREKLMWEMGFTIEHFYELHLKRTLRTADRKIIMDGLEEICGFLAGLPTVLAHRDFHSRNIMVLEPERFVMIDFQDARMGPAVYDLASLLRDSYYQLEEAQISRLLDYYVARWEALSGQPVNRDEFRYAFDMMSVQRNFKAIGSFASFLNRRGNPTYLKYIGNTFENIRRTLLKYPQYSRLRETLFHYYYF